eukprot:SAG31_NODE_9874_length_1218_cov_0.986595_1_plen_110_part_00
MLRALLPLVLPLLAPRLAGAPVAPTAASDPGQLCDVEACECDGVSLAAEKGRQRVLTDAAGFTYKITVCGAIPTFDLPSGCQQYGQQATAIKYRDGSPDNCEQIGSVLN